MQKINYNKQFIDHLDIKEVTKSLKSKLITTGPYIEKLENAFKKYLSVNEVITCSSGTAALYIAMRAINIKKDDVVIMPAINFIASTNVANILGARIFLCDVDSRTGQITPETLTDCIKINKINKIKLVITMYLGGTPYNIAKFYNLKKKYNFFLIEDSCHALGASYRHKNKFVKIGGCLHSDISVFSLHPVKSITTGEGGVITTRSKSIGNKLRLLRSHGILRNKKKYWEYDILSPTLNFRMSDVNAALGFSQLKKLPKFIKKRKEIANLYFKNLDNFKKIIKISKVDRDIISAYHLLIISFDFKKLSISKNDLIKKLNKKNIFPQYHYIPIYKYTFYKNLNSPGNFKNSENYYKSALSFPIYYKLEKKNLMKVFKCVKEILIKHLK